MTKADLIYKDNLREILINGSWDENPRPKYDDGTPAYSKFITQVFEKYDLSKGELPITTLRPIAIKGGINEILAIYQTQTNSQKGFESHNIKWWSPWMNDEGNIGRAYSYNLESHRPNEMKREVVKVKRRTVDEELGEPKEVKVDNIDSNPLEVYEKYQLLAIDKKSRKYLLQSLTTGEKRWVSKNPYNKIKDNNESLTKNSPFIFDRNFYGIGYLGDLNNAYNFKEDEITILKRKWVAMLKRCYSNDEYYNKTYSDIFVHQEWHSFEQFLKDVRYLPQYHLAKENDFVGWELDKDYFGSNCYSKDTCVFLNSDENKLYTKSYPVMVSTPSNKKELIIDVSKYCREHGISQGNAHSVIKGERQHAKRYIFEKIIYDESEIYRYELSRNQIVELLKSLEKDEFSRRHMLSFFHWSNQDKKMLVECAFQSMISVRKLGEDKYLDWTLVQRSSDYAVAGHINMMQYVALQMMIAHHLGMKVGTFARYTQNLHIYDKHLDQAYEMLKREPSKEQPQLILNAEGKSFYEITSDDFELINYHPVKPQLKFDLGI